MGVELSIEAFDAICIALFGSDLKRGNHMHKSVTLWDGTKVSYDFEHVWIDVFSPDDLGTPVIRYFTSINMRTV